MKVTAIGVGGAFTNKLFNTSMLLEEGKSKLLLDCGRNTPEALYAAGVDIKTITHFFISHGHEDHLNGLANLLLKRYDFMRKPKTFEERHPDWPAPNLICDIDLLKDIWKRSIEINLTTMEGFVATPDTFYRSYGIKKNQIFVWEGWSCQLVRQVHVVSGVADFMNSYGLMMSKNGKTVFFATDCQYMTPEQVASMLKECDIIFMDCECIGCDTANKKALYRSSVHANFAQLAGWESANSYKLPDDIKSKIYLTHYADFVVDGKDEFGNTCDWFQLAKDEGLAGFIKLHQEFEI